ncbi:MAG: tetratricopeptide repeat protein, partial [Planctomycetota bacterium]|nr:tetratricopeptide repeat protein [Planctomycetota bacterium]
MNLINRILLLTILFSFPLSLRAQEEPPQNAIDLLEKGYASYKKGLYQDAIDSYTEAIQIFPNYGLAYRVRGDAKRQSKDNEGAISDYTSALKINPEDVTAYNLRGVAWSNLKDHQKAIADYTKAVSINPDYHWGYYNRALSLEA